MKKLLTIISSLAMACSLHAASAVWGFTSAMIEDSTGNYMDGGTALLYLGTVTASDSEFNLGTATLLASGGQNAAYTYGETDDPVALAGLASDTAGQAYTLILLEQSNASLAGYDGNYILVNGTSQRATDPMSGDTWAVMTDGTDFVASDWQTMTAGSGGGGGGGTTDVPEPTSGLLLAIGGAMLALRRRA